MKKIRDEQRQHLRLSRMAYERIVADSISFGNKINPLNRDDVGDYSKANISGMVNKIFLNYYEKAEASISIVANSNRVKFKGQLAERGTTSNKSEYNMVIEHLVEAISEELQQKSNSYPREISLKIRLQNDVYDILFPEEDSLEDKQKTWWPEQDYYRRRGDYIGAVIEEYAQKNHYDRESIYFAEKIDELERLIEGTPSGHRIVTIDYLTASGKQIKSDVKPYKITNPSESEYHYLVGLSRPSGRGTGDYSVGVFRLNRVISYKVRSKSYGSGKLTQHEKVQLEKDIHKRGVQFLIDTDEESRVLLTENGLKKYYNQMHLRPVALKIERQSDGSSIAYFDCTYTQIRYYFFEFGKDAVVLYPDSLHDEFELKYKEAAAMYSGG